MPDQERVPRRGLGLIYCVLALLCLLLVWKGLPLRWIWVDAVATALSGIMAVTGLMLLLGLRFGEALAYVCASLMLAVGLGVVSILFWTVTYLWGVYGPVGQGGALILLVVALLILPYFVLFPLWQLWAIRRSP